MNKKAATFVALGALAFIAGANPANAARTKTTYVTLDGFCDTVTVTVFPWHQAGHKDADCDGVNGIGAGMEGKVTGVSPRDLTFGETYTDATPGTIYLWNMQYPLVTGGTWSIFKSTDGATFSFVNSGTYTITHSPVSPFSRAGRSAHHPVQSK